MDILDILLDILLKPPQPFIGLFFTGPLSDVFPDVEKIAGFCSGGYFEFWPQNWQKGVKICCPE